MAPDTAAGCPCGNSKSVDENGCHTAPDGSCVSDGSCQCATAPLACECCEKPLPVGTPAKMDRETGVVICNECFADLTAVKP